MKIYFYCKETGELFQNSQLPNFVGIYKNYSKYRLRKFLKKYNSNFKIYYVRISNN